MVVPSCEWSVSPCERSLQGGEPPDVRRETGPSASLPLGVPPVSLTSPRAPFTREPWRARSPAPYDSSATMRAETAETGATPMEPAWGAAEVRARPASASRPVETAIHWYDGALHAWVAPPERGDRWTGLHAVAALPLEIPYGPPRPASRPFGGGRTSPSGSAGGRLPGLRGRPGARNGPRAGGGRARIAPDPAAPAAAPSPLEAGLTNACFNEVDRHVAAGRGDEAALVDLTGAGSRSPRVLTRKQFLLTVVKAAHALAQLGVAEGDRVLLRLPPSAPAVIYLAAIKRLGAVALWAPPGRDEPAAPPCLATRGARAGVRVMVTGGRDSREGGRDPGAVEGWAEVPGVEAVIRVGDAGDGLLSGAGRAVVANARAAGFPVAGETDLLILPDADLVRALWTTSRPRPVPAGQRAWV
ncbi:MAG: hypothetical protein DIU76_11450 [Bacillota bacterium]|nr:MAG: hypothetical protein DIU76_11450 [Bacillota bacterium]